MKKITMILSYNNYFMVINLVIVKLEVILHKIFARHSLK